MIYDTLPYIYTTGPCDDTPSVTGICEAHTYAVTFRDGQCQQFIYGGCGATKNYFSYVYIYSILL